MTIISTGPFCDSSFKPSCSWMAVNREGPLGSMGGSDGIPGGAPPGGAPPGGDWNCPCSGVYSTLMSYFPVRLVLSSTVRPVKRESGSKTVTAPETASGEFFSNRCAKAFKRCYHEPPVVPPVKFRCGGNLIHGGSLAPGPYPIAHGMEQRGAGCVRAVDPERRRTSKCRKTIRTE